jgi:hypothetical protein
MTGEPAWLDSGMLVGLKRMAAMRGEPDIPDWPDLCWLPMPAVGSHIAAAGVGERLAAVVRVRAGEVGAEGSGPG